MIVDVIERRQCIDSMNIHKKAYLQIARDWLNPEQTTYSFPSNVSYVLPELIEVMLVIAKHFVSSFMMFMRGCFFVAYN